MRKPSPTALFAAVSLALCAHAATAQTGAASAPRAVGTNGSTVTTSTRNASPAGNTVTTTSGETATPGTAPAPSAQQSTNPGPAPGNTGQGTNATTVVNPQSGTSPNAQTQAQSRGVIGIAPAAGVDSGIAVGGAGSASAAGTGNGQVVVLNAANLNGSVTSTPELDRATRKELNKAKAASHSRNKQLLYTIAPRTNADRRDEMPDDPPSPALSTPERAIPRY